MLRQAAFSPNGRPLLKGALHTHTTRSDGRVEPAALLFAYQDQGYAFAALTDHRIYNYQGFGNTGLTILPGMEMDRNIPEEGFVPPPPVPLAKVSREEGNGFSQDQRFEKGFAEDQLAFQSVLDMLHENGNLTFYCHPQWSSTPAREFEKLRGNFAMEIWNTGCAYENDSDTNAAYWDELLMQGQVIYGVATDDCHHPEHIGKGFVMVNSENTVSGILRALKNGAFYSSCGPVIHDFFIENGKAVLECSPCRHVVFLYGRAPGRMFRDPEGLITRAEFTVPSHYAYLRANVMDAEGRRAWTNPIFLK